MSITSSKIRITGNYSLSSLVGSLGGGGGGGGGGPSTSYLSDTDLTYLKAGYSMRKFNPNYTGACMKVSLGATPTTQANIGFNSSGVLDTDALLTFAGSDSAYVVTWYDQVGTYNLDGGGSTIRPRIVNAGSLETTINSLPGINTVGNTRYFSATSLQIGPTVANVAHVYAVVTTQQNTYNGAIFGASTGGGWSMAYNTLGQLFVLKQQTTNYGTGNTNGGALTPNQPALIETMVSPTGNIVRAWKDNYLQLQVSPTNPVFSIATLQLPKTTGNFLNGIMTEFLYFDNASDLPDRTTVQTNVKTFWGTP